MIVPQHDVQNDQEAWPRFYEAQIIEDGQTLAVLVREWDGSISAVRIDIRQVAD
mgnify:CR=1 FL=1